MSDVRQPETEPQTTTRFLPPLLAAEHEECFARYARYLVEHAVALREGQRLEILCGLGHRPFAFRVGEAAYAAGAGEVRYRFVDPLEIAQLIRLGRPEQILLHHVGNQDWHLDVLRSRGAVLILDGPTDPQMLDELRRTHPESSELFSHENVAVSLEFHDRAVERRLCPVVSAVSPTPAWACRTFPKLPEDEAFRRLSELIFRFTFTDRDDGLEAAVAQARLLGHRAAALNELGIRELRFRGGGNDLRVGLCEKSRWGDVSMRTTTGQRYLSNVPSFEVYTTPDRLRTEGRLVTARPFRLLDGTLVEGLELEFRRGRIIAVRARRGAETFERWLDVDEGGRYLGEIALVGEDSPIARSGTIFGHVLLDENAAIHVGIGQGFPAGIEDGTIDVNRSAIHLDVPFGSRAVRVVARGGAGDETVVMERGCWSMI